MQARASCCEERRDDELAASVCELVAENCLSSVCSLHRLDVSQHLFYPSTVEAEATKPAVFGLSLPTPTYNFHLTDVPSWEWERLPPPPLSEGSDIYTHAVLDGGRVICVSASPFGGTYLFDTVGREWMRQATSDWHMPFLGAPQYVPDLKLWLGVSWSGDEDDSDRHHLCASSDLGGAVDAATRGEYRPSVTVTHHWKEGLETPVG